MATYSIGFFSFWALTCGSSMLTCFSQRPASEVNRRRGSNGAIGEGAKPGDSTGAA